MSSNYKNELRRLEEELETYPLSEETEERIRNARIAVVDDEIESLRSMLDGMRDYGFTNIVEIDHVSSPYDLVRQGIDLIVLDIVGVASDKFDREGVSVLTEVKNLDPALPVLVLSGSTTRPAESYELAKADRILTKPVKAGDLGKDVRELLKRRKDRIWASLSLLQAMDAIRRDPEFQPSIRERIRLARARKKLVRKVRNLDQDIEGPIRKINSVFEKYQDIGVGVLKFAAVAVGA